MGFSHWSAPWRAAATGGASTCSSSSRSSSSWVLTISRFCNAWIFWMSWYFPGSLPCKLGIIHKRSKSSSFLLLLSMLKTRQKNVFIQLRWGQTEPTAGDIRTLKPHLQLPPSVNIYGLELVLQNTVPGSLSEQFRLQAELLRPTGQGGGLTPTINRKAFQLHDFKCNNWTGMFWTRSFPVTLGRLI